MMQPEEGRRRVQVDFSPKAHKQLVQIRKRSGARTNAEMVRNALRFYKWYLQLKQKGGKLQLVEEGVVKNVELLL